MFAVWSAVAGVTTEALLSTHFAGLPVAAGLCGRASRAEGPGPPAQGGRPRRALGGPAPLRLPAPAQHLHHCQAGAPPPPAGCASTTVLLGCRPSAAAGLTQRPHADVPPSQYFSARGAERERWVAQHCIQPPSSPYCLPPNACALPLRMMTKISYPCLRAPRPAPAADQLLALPDATACSHPASPAGPTCQ